MNKLKILKDWDTGVQSTQWAGPHMNMAATKIFYNRESSALTYL